MIAGVGMDLCGVERMRKACESEAFCRRVFTEAELSYAAGKKSRACHLAAAYAAKEAFAKAIVPVFFAVSSASVMTGTVALFSFSIRRRRRWSRIAGRVFIFRSAMTAASPPPW